MTFDDGFGDGETKPRMPAKGIAFGAIAVEPAKHGIARVHGNAGAIVFDPDHGVIVTLHDAEPDLSHRRGEGKRIVDEVFEDARKAGFVSTDDDRLKRPRKPETFFERRIAGGTGIDNRLNEGAKIGWLEC